MLIIDMDDYRDLVEEYDHMLDSKHYPEAHLWSGWPGAYCQICFVEHAIENALALGWYDPYTDEWDTAEHAQIVIQADAVCLGG